MKQKNTNISNQRKQPKNPIPPDVALAVWEAEDGRCEMCSRTMDRKVARFRKVDSTYLTGGDRQSSPFLNLLSEYAMKW